MPVCEPQKNMLPVSSPGHPKLTGSVWIEGCCLEPASLEIAVAGMLKQEQFSDWIKEESQSLHKHIGKLVFITLVSID